MTITAKLIKYSIGPERDHLPVLTVECRYPRLIHSELLTHRMFSRNAASSRAIKTEKLIEDVMSDPAIPIHWGKNQPGMQAREENHSLILLPNDPDGYFRTNENAWLKSRDQAVEMAKAFMEAGYHKQIVNRILEPYAHITTLITSVSWANFFALRDHPDAQPEIQELARQIKKLKQEATPKQLEVGEWHLPYLTEEDKEFLEIDQQLDISIARCASTSYKTVDGQTMTLERAGALAKKLMDANPLHASPAEHICKPDIHDVGAWRQPEYHGNLTGYIQYRKLFNNEYVQD